MTQFHRLTVTNIRKTIRDAVVVTLQPKEETTFAFTQGQYLTFKRDFGGTELRRSYSICAGKDDGILQVGIKKVDGGAFSTWANDEMRAGDVLQAMPPQGRFFTDLDPSQAKTYLAFAGGSGITPVMSLIKTTLQIEPESQFNLVYANRAVTTIMLREELEDLKNAYMGRLNIIHILETNGEDIDLFTGRIDRHKCELLFEKWINLPDVDTAYICGPEPMMRTIADALNDNGLAEENIKYELFGSGQPGQLARRPRSKADAKAKAVQINVTLDGATYAFEMEPGQSVLEAALANNIDAPFACQAGVCSTCRCKLLKGEVDMLTNHALEDYEVERGYILSCQSYPVSDEVRIDYDRH